MFHLQFLIILNFKVGIALSPSQVFLSSLSLFTTLQMQLLWSVQYCTGMGQLSETGDILWIGGFLSLGHLMLLQGLYLVTLSQSLTPLNLWLVFFLFRRLLLFLFTITDTNYGGDVQIQHNRMSWNEETLAQLTGRMFLTSMPAVEYPER